jgi:hypothetical protein
MKKFIKKTILISLPIIFIGMFIKIFISYYPNTFNTKANYLNSNLENIEILFLGSSHTQNGVNPKFIDISSANIAYGSQDYQLNSAIYFKYISRLKKLKKLIIELDYHSLEQKNNADYFRLPWYYKYHDINLGDFKPYNKISLFLSNPDFFKNYLIRKLNPQTKKFTINKFGFVENDFGIFEKFNFDKVTIAETALTRLKNRHNSVSIANFDVNKEILELILDDCIAKNIEVIILKTPQYLTYRNNYNKDKLERRRILLDSLLSIGEIKVLDFETDVRFNVKDFKNDDHLNSKGAEKLSKLINEEINTWR